MTEFDMRKVFDHNIGVVSFGTPNHWPVGPIWACQADKHIYVEKTISHNMFRRQKMIEAARPFKVCVQVGTQFRSSSNMMQAINFLHQGGVANIDFARVLWIEVLDSFGIAKDSRPPSSLHYDQWFGTETRRTYNEERGHYNWHSFCDLGNGDAGNTGPHQLDTARWGLNKNEHPISVYSTSGIYGIDPSECAHEIPNTQNSLFNYKSGTMLKFETRGRYSNGERSLNLRVGNIVHDTEDYLQIGNGGFRRASRQREAEPFARSKTGEKNEIDQPSSPTSVPLPYFGNFIHAFCSEKLSDLNYDVLERHYSSSLPHLAVVFYRLKRELKFMRMRKFRQ